ncbi:MAG TPA: oxidoreductase [Gammaproteobacteria bacterium]|jgi:NAD(P)-dependent dehydrogenase (short-subunit alcohol dehydrogenase family)|nr:SDR family oxidoreductase [Pseudomonadota bacterium]HAY44907.1 oxidoreductase [Gammaproteobacteria bacterium]
MSKELKSPHELFDISGKVAVVTGSLGAFGSVAARTLSKAGSKLVIADDKQDKLDELAIELKDDGGEVLVVAKWPNSTENCAAIIEAAVSAYGRLDILVVASGTMDVDPIIDMDVSRFEEVMRVNVTDSWMMTQAAGRQMTEQGDGGKVVLVSSARGLLGHPAGYSAYCSSKHAVNGIVKALGCEWGKEGITINALAPTVFRSNQTSWMFEDDELAAATRKSILSRIPMGRLGEPEDLAGPLLFLVSPASDFHTGHTISPDGGYTAG